MNARHNKDWWLYKDMDSVESFEVRRIIEDIITQLPRGYRAQAFKIRMMKRLLKDALNRESPDLLLEEIGEIIRAATLAGVPKNVLTTASYEQIVKATLAEARKTPGFNYKNLYCKN